MEDLRSEPTACRAAIYEVHLTQISNLMFSSQAFSAIHSKEISQVVLDLYVKYNLFVVIKSSLVHKAKLRIVFQSGIFTKHCQL